MKRFLCLLLFLFALSLPPASRAQVTLGDLAASFDCTPTKLLADPARSRIYAADPVSSSIVVIDTAALKIIATVPLGAYPADMALSLDGSILYAVAYGGSTPAVTALDLETLAVRHRFHLPAGTPLAVAAGLERRLYVAVLDANSESAIYQLDSVTGAVQATFGRSIYDTASFLLGPDGKTLFVNSCSRVPGNLRNFDVSTARATPLQTSAAASNGTELPILSPDGGTIYLPAFGVNEPTAGDLLPFADITPKYFSGIDFVGNTGPAAYSPDGLLIYQTFPQDNYMYVLTPTDDFIHDRTLMLPVIKNTDRQGDILAVTVDRTGSYLFVSQTDPAASIQITRKGYTGPTVIARGRLAAVGTGNGTLSPAIPVVDLTPRVSSLFAGKGGTATIEFTRTGSTDKQLEVAYSIRGDARNGVDYHPLSGKVTFHAGQSKAVFQVVPNAAAFAKAAPPENDDTRRVARELSSDKLRLADDGGGVIIITGPGTGGGTPVTYNIKRVTLVLHPSPHYQPGAPRKATVKFLTRTN